MPSVELIADTDDVDVDDVDDDDDEPPDVLLLLLLVLLLLMLLLLLLLLPLFDKFLPIFVASNRDAFDDDS